MHMHAYTHACIYTCMQATKTALRCHNFMRGSVGKWHWSDSYNLYGVRLECSQSNNSHTMSSYALVACTHTLNCNSTTSRRTGRQQAAGRIKAPPHLSQRILSNQGRTRCQTTWGGATTGRSNTAGVQSTEVKHDTEDKKTLTATQKQTAYSSQWRICLCGM